MKIAILVLSDPKAGTEEALGRLFNALAAAYDFQQSGVDVTIVFLGTGTRWLGVLQDRNHPGYELFQEVKHLVAGASCGCADIFGASEEVVNAGFELIKDSSVPGTSRVASLPLLVSKRYQLLTF